MVWIHKLHLLISFCCPFCFSSLGYLWHHIIWVKKMGLKLSKKDALLEDHDLSHVQRYLVRYLSTSSYVRTVVSKQRRRLFVEGYDLDMSYITDRILAMSFPAERMRAVYRNPLWQVRSVLEMRHQGHYKVWYPYFSCKKCTLDFLKQYPFISFCFLPIIY